MTDMTVITMFPRQRLSTSPSRKNNPTVHGNCASRTTPLQGESRNTLQKNSSSPSLRYAMENLSTKGNPQTQNQQIRSWLSFYIQCVIMSIFLVTMIALLNILTRTRAIMNDIIHDTSSIPSSRSLQAQREGGSKHQELSTFHPQFNDVDNASPRIVWLMSFPNRYIKFIT
jgi:hypothetical protein